MSVRIIPLTPTGKELKKYIEFGISLYKGNDCYVPPLISDEVDTLLPELNPAYDFCEAQSFMAERDGKIVGTVTAIINRAANEKTSRSDLRFGWLEFIDDAEVSRALFDAVAAWGRERGMTRMVGPMGFSDMDHEGMLIEGFNELGTMATIYNHPYYPVHMERLGFAKEVDWVEFRIKVPDGIPDKYKRIADLVSRKFGLRVKKYTDRKAIAEDYGHAIFELINEAYADLYGYSTLTPRQIDHYIKIYLGLLRLEDVTLVVDKDDKLVAVGISMPSMSRALQKSGGKLFPFGWWHLLRAMKGHSDVVDLLLVAVKPEYQNKGVNALLFSDLIPNYVRNGYKEAESNIELEENEAVQKQWEYFERRQHRRRRAFAKAIN